jgi:hypothetical protein
LSAAKGSFKGGSYIGNLANNGTGFAFDSVKPSMTLSAALTKIAKGIKSGTISTDPNSYPVG